MRMFMLFFLAVSMMASEPTPLQLEIMRRDHLSLPPIIDEGKEPIAQYVDLPCQSCQRKNCSSCATMPAPVVAQEQDILAKLDALLAKLDKAVKDVESKPETAKPVVAAKAEQPLFTPYYDKLSDVEKPIFTAVEDTSVKQKPEVKTESKIAASIHPPRASIVIPSEMTKPVPPPIVATVPKKEEPTELQLAIMRRDGLPMPPIILKLGEHYDPKSDPNPVQSYYCPTCPNGQCNLQRR